MSFPTWQKGEVRFVLGKDQDGGSRALTEEETDAALDAMAAEANAKLLESGHGPVVSAASSASAPCRPSGALGSASSSSSSGPPVQPAVAEPSASSSSSSGPPVQPAVTEPLEPPANAGPPVARQAGGIRLPRAADMASPHPECTLRQYSPAGKAPYWIATLPPGVRFEGKKTHTKSFSGGVGGAGEALAKQSCYAYLCRAVAAGALGPV